MLSVDEPFVFDGINSADKMPDEGRKILAHWFYNDKEWYGVFRVGLDCIINLHDDSFLMLDDYTKFEWRYLDNTKT